MHTREHVEENVCAVVVSLVCLPVWTLLGQDGCARLGCRAAGQECVVPWLCFSALQLSWMLKYEKEKKNKPQTVN